MSGWSPNTKGGQSSHKHLNKSVLDKFGEAGGQPTFNGVAIGGSSGASVDLFIRDSINLLNPIDVEQGKGFADPTVNTIAVNELNSLSGFIPVGQQLPYTTSADYLLWAWYNSGKQFISGHWAAGGINTAAAGKQNDSPVGAAFLRVSGPKDKMANLMVVQGTYLSLPSAFVPYDQWGFSPKVIDYFDLRVKR